MDITTKQVRQILINELGLSRESVRETMRELVEQTMRAYLEGEQFQHFLASRVQQQFEKDSGWRRGSESDFKKSFREKVQSEISKRAVALAESRFAQVFPDLLPLDTESIRESRRSAVGVCPNILTPL
jgi:hypothetical protein